MTHYKALLFSAALALSALVPLAQAATPPAGGCVAGSMFNPMTDTDWNNMYPIVTAGVPSGALYPQSPLHVMPPACVCPGVFGVPAPGIGVTYWEPLYISEIERTAGCLSSLGGTNALSGYASLSSEQLPTNGHGGGSANRMQVHWYEYPVMAMLDMFASVYCHNPGGFALGYMTELDPTWQNDLWGVVFSPEGELFANPVAQAACAVDGAAATAGFPIDAMFWCAGTWGSTYPLTGNAPHGNSPFTMNNLVQAKFIARMHRVALLWQSIGPTAMCFSHPNPIWMKSQYRINQVAPFPRYGMPVQIGSAGLSQFPTITNAPSKESTVNLIWQGKQCCMTMY